MSKSNATAYIASINFILGAGILGIPIAFVHAGLVTAVLLLAIISTLSAAAMVWEVEAISRAEWLMDRQAAASETSRIIPASVIADSTGRPARPDYYLTSGRLDLIAVSGFFLGDFGRYTYMFAQSFYTFVTMWFYTVVVAISLTNTFPVPGLDVEGHSTTECGAGKGLFASPVACQQAYHLFALIYAMAMVLSMINDAIIRRLQIALAIFADLCIFLMVVTALIALVKWSHGKTSYEEITSTPFFFNPDGFGLAFSAFIFAQLAMHGVPVLIEYMETPKQAKWIFSAALGTSMVMYAALGIICALFFASDVDSVITLHWRYYTHVDGGTALSTAISYIVRAFPVVTISAAFPLNAVALGKAMEMRVSDQTFAKWGIQPGWRTLFCRVFVSLPSVVCANLMTKVTTLMVFAGVLAYVLGFIIPATLQIVSTAAVRRHWAEHELGAEPEKGHGPSGGLSRRQRDPSWTPYSWHFSHRPYAIFTLGFAIVAIPYSLAVAFQ